MVRSRFTILLLSAFSLLLPARAAALEPHRGPAELVIVSAQYGTERHHVDVTPRLREAARHDRMFRAANRAFGVDPDPGVVKTLRIYAVGPDGREQMFEYREDAIVDGGLFRGWDRGEWAGANLRWSGRWNLDEGEFAILSAQYGTEHHHVDVTGRLKELAHADRHFLMGNRSFGIDPDPGKVKTLRIYAMGPNGREQMFEYIEGSVVDGAKFSGWGRGEFATGKGRWSGRW